MAKGIIRKLSRAQRRVNKFIAINTNQNSLASRGLSSEGYSGGYGAALADVLSMLCDVPVCNRPEYWENENRLDDV